MRTPTLTITDRDIERVRALTESRKDDEFVLERRDRNVNGPAPVFDYEEFWRVLMGCLLTSQQRSTKGSPVDRFTEKPPFLLPLDRCSKNTEATVRSVLASFGGIRFVPTIAGRVTANYQRLEAGEWRRVEHYFCKLAAQRARAPHPNDATREREAAHFAAGIFAGIGPKQSRNLWQWLGLTRYEIPLDSRICDWINKNLSVTVDVPNLAASRYYDAVLDCTQELCNQAGILPCIFDAAAFDYQEKGTSRCATG